MKSGDRVRVGIYLAEIIRLGKRRGIPSALVQYTDGSIPRWVPLSNIRPANGGCEL